MSALLRHVLLLQRDVPAAAKFYTEGLGLVAHVCTDRWAELGDASSASSSSDPPRTLIALQAVDGEAHRSTGYSPILNFTVSDLDATVNSLLRAGATLDGPIGYPARGRVAALRAPDGHMLGLYEPAEGGGGGGGGGGA